MPFPLPVGGGSGPHDILSVTHPDSDDADVPVLGDVLTFTGAEWDAQPGGAGLPGPAGPMGAPGIMGDEGEPGPIGAPGPTGATGGSGAPGPAGIGLPGPEGDEGPIGPPGPPGAAGQAGAVGPAGPQAFAFLVGEEGEPGAIGPPGATGAAGPAGAAADYDKPETGSLSVATAKYHYTAVEHVCTTTQRITVAGTGRLRIHN